MKTQNPTTSILIIKTETLLFNFYINRGGRKQGGTGGGGGGEAGAPPLCTDL